MQARLAGGLLLVVGLTLAVVIPTLGGLRTAGIGVPIQLPEYPKVGDCLQEPLNDVILTSPATSMSQRAPTFVPCDGRIVGGQVVAVVRATGDVRARIVQAANSGIDCYHSILERSGLIPIGGRYVLAAPSSTDAVEWNLTINVRAAWIVPAPLLRTMGHDWVACVAAPLSGATFPGEVADAFIGGKLPDEFGFCWEQSALSGKGSVSCADGHRAELVSLGTIPAGTTVALSDIESSCRSLAAKVIGRADPTADGHLVVETSVSPVAAQSSTQQTRQVICYIRPVTRVLSGSLVGLGDRPIPYAK